MEDVMSNRWTSVSATVVALALASVLSAQTPGAGQRFTYTVPGAPESTVDGKGPFQLTLQRWSTDEERDRMLQAMAGESSGVLDAVRDAGYVGYLRWPGGLEYSLRYARQARRPDGRTEIVLVADRPLWIWWDSSKSSSAMAGDGQFSLIQIRMDGDTGEARLASGGGVTSDKETGVALAEQAKQPVVITGVRRGQA
jgi:hypothetical protein